MVDEGKRNWGIMPKVVYGICDFWASLVRGQRILYRILNRLNCLRRHFLILRLCLEEEDYLEYILGCRPLHLRRVAVRFRGWIHGPFPTLWNATFLSSHTKFFVLAGEHAKRGWIHHMDVHCPKTLYRVQSVQLPKMPGQAHRLGSWCKRFRIQFLF